MPLPKNEGDAPEFLAVSTEDGRAIFYRTDLSAATFDGDNAKIEVKLLQPVAQFGGASDGLTGRIKDFEALRLPGAAAVVIIACGSDGAIRLWLVEDTELTKVNTTANGSASQLSNGGFTKPKGNGRSQTVPQPVGQLIGLYESKNRITCVAAFLLSEPTEHETTDLQNSGTSVLEEDEEDKSIET